MNVGMHEVESIETNCKEHELRGRKFFVRTINVMSARGKLEIKLFSDHKALLNLED